jgi:hypothetical protein
VRLLVGLRMNDLAVEADRHRLLAMIARSFEAAHYIKLVANRFVRAAVVDAAHRNV